MEGVVNVFLPRNAGILVVRPHQADQIKNPVIDVPGDMPQGVRLHGHQVKMVIGIAAGTVGVRRLHAPAGRIQPVAVMAALRRGESLRLEEPARIPVTLLVPVPVREGKEPAVLVVLVNHFPRPGIVNPLYLPYKVSLFVILVPA